jgi:multidrug resistance efflux pump
MMRLLFGLLCLGVALVVHHEHASADGRWQTTFDAHVRAKAAPSGDAWIAAYFSRSQLAKISPGQVANVKINGISALFYATVDSIGSPQETATSPRQPDDPARKPPGQSQQRWVKLVLDHGQADEERLLPGMSAIVSVRTGGPRPDAGS